MRTVQLSTFLAVVAMCGTAIAEKPNSLSSEEDRKGFVLLFHGTDLGAWKHMGNWKVVDGEITRTGRGGSLVYAKSTVPDDFELRFEWKVAAGSNSGVYYRPGQYEYQILDNAKHADGKNPRTSAASIYFCMQPSHDATKPIGQWNEGRIVCKGSVIQHWLNGKKVIHMDYEDPQWAWNVSLLDKRGGDLKARGGQLSLQDHGDPVWYRSIRWRALDENDELDSTPVKPAEISDAVLAAEEQKIQQILAGRARQKQRAKNN